MTRNYNAIMLGVLAAMFGLCCQTATSRPNASQNLAAPSMAAPLAMLGTHESRERLLAEQPLAFLRACRLHYDETVTDYRCRFVKEERIKGALGPEQKMDVLFREQPFSVDLVWTANPGRAKHVSYVQGRWVEDGNEMMLAVPSGVLGLLVPGGVKRAINGKAALARSRKPISNFGYKNSLDLIIKYCELARGHSEFRLEFLGVVDHHGRDAYLLERVLPYSGEGGVYPDRLLRIYIDTEWLVPTGVYAYMDDEAKTPLGKYLLLDPEFNVGLNDLDF